MIAREDGDERAVAMRFAALPPGEKFGDLLEPAERTGGLGELPLPLARRVACGRVGLGHSSDEGADVVEGAGIVGHGGVSKVGKRGLLGLLAREGKCR